MIKYKIILKKIKTIAIITINFVKIIKNGYINKKLKK